jgi:hypothetical protein
VVGVIEGEGVWRTLTWTGTRKTAPETPTGVVNTAIRKAEAAPIRASVLIGPARVRFLD